MFIVVQTRGSAAACQALLGRKALRTGKVLGWEQGQGGCCGAEAWRKALSKRTHDLERLGVGTPKLQQGEPLLSGSHNQGIKTPARPSVPRLSLPALPCSQRLRSSARISQHTDGLNGGMAAGSPASPAGLLLVLRTHLWRTMGLLPTGTTLVFRPRFVLPGAHGLGWGCRRGPAG